MLRVIAGGPGMTWCRARETRNILRQICTTYCTKARARDFNMWKQQFELREPEFNLEYLLDEKNRDVIRKNVANRKGVGDIDRVVELWKRLNEEPKPDIQEKLKIAFLTAASEIPNTSHPESPVGDEDESRQVELIGAPRVEDGLKSIVELGEHLGMLRVSNVNMTTGPSTYYFTDQLAQLEQALVTFTIKFLLNKGFELVSVPDLLHPHVIEGCGFKTSGDVAQVYHLDPSRHERLCLAGTAEMALAGFLGNEVLNEEDLPKRLASVSRCYRAETSDADSALGIYRVHQFTKVEMFCVTASDVTESSDMLQELLDIEKTLFSQLQLHFRVLDMSTAELGAPAHRKYDIEAWMPASQLWGEISSTSNCTDFQSRRLHVKYRTRDGELRHCHTVNGTACAVPRTIIALCETHQTKDGSVRLPNVLWSHMNGQTELRQPDQPTNLQWIKANRFT
ncbi:serine--tRNA ligase, mitochondrial-like [Mya arenaria]|uniref:serine--tRNA ligase, mitochondrial-like n=1 Tax=Mya arenaria TaxID=6604 RepID=UPI0022E42D0B|nr:serine--tRNA ligase, mitochondrial-like [Mya arenaria]